MVKTIVPKCFRNITMPSTGIAQSLNISLEAEAFSMPLEAVNNCTIFHLSKDLSPITLIFSGFSFEFDRNSCTD